MGLPSLQAVVGGGASLLVSHIFQGGGGVENYLGWGGGGRGFNSGVWEGVLFFVSQVVFYEELLLGKLGGESGEQAVGWGSCHFCKKVHQHNYNWHIGM